jgi:Zn-dependent protease/CBS domain-containing protein
MNRTLQLGRVAGIRVGLNWTWLFVFAFFVWSLAASVFPATNPGLATSTYLVMALCAALLFFASLLLHELGHALRARREGMEIDGITLWLLGGVARFRGMFPSAGAEFRIALAGPVVTALLAGVFGAATILTHFAPAIDGTFAWLAYVNLFLLGFNLLPALPLDGGRIFRSALWRVRGDLAWATRIASTVGIGIGWLMVAGGVVAVLTLGAYGGIWLALIGWFVLIGARGESRLVRMGEALEGLTVDDLMSINPPTARADQTLGDFLATVSPDEPLAAYPVVEGPEAVGILRSPRRADGTLPEEWATVRVRDRMLGLDRVAVFAPDEPASGAMVALAEAGTDSALVLEHGHLAGVLTARDVAEALRAAPRPRAGGRRRSPAST